MRHNVPVIICSVIKVFPSTTDEMTQNPRSMFSYPHHNFYNGCLKMKSCYMRMSLNTSFLSHHAKL